MFINKTILAGIYVVIAVFILYRLFFKKDTYKEEYEKLYNHILTSDKFKVKSQNDKR